MNTTQRKIAVAELLLIFPAALFMVSLVVRALPFGPVHAAQQIVMWYSGRIWTLWVLLFAMPLAVLVIGCTALFANAGRGLELRGVSAAIRSDRAMLMSAITALAAALILVIVGVHVLMN
jgi:hypothetical protein